MPPKGSKHPRNTQGLVNPGTKIAKRKSSHNLHDSPQQANGDVEPPPPPPLNSPATASSSSANGTLTAGGDTSHTADKPVQDYPAQPYEGSAPPHHHFPPAPLAMDTNKHATGNKSATAMKQLSLAATTILTSCPQRDVIAMLILLLQLSPPVLFAVDFLFAIMTSYVPRPSNSALIVPTLQGLFEGAGGAPSMATVVLIDAIFFVLWVFLPLQIKNVGLDLAQAVIALSFSGATSNKGGPPASIGICLITIVLFRTLGHRSTRHTLISAISNLLWTTLNKSSSRIRESPDPGGTGRLFARDYPSAPRTLVGVHILAQGILRFIRRQLWASRESAPAFPPIKKVDPEAALSNQTPRSNSLTSEKNSDGASGSPTDGRPPGPSPAASDAKEAYIGKKKRKQATHVRSQQPFWAALAHTKVTVSNQMEQTHLTLDQSEAQATDVHHIGNANFQAETDRVWVTDLGSTDIRFGIALLETEESGNHSSIQKDDSMPPFYVRVNGARWSSIRVSEAVQSVRGDGEQVRVWQGEIFGLTARCNYHCQFMRSSDECEIYSASLITQPAPFTEQAPAPSNHQALRPSSPATTLRNSIAATEAQLAEQRNKLKRVRKEHKSAADKLKKEVDTLSNRLASAGSNDEKTKQRQSQLRQSIQQAEQAISIAEAQAGELGEIPEEDLDVHREKKRAWQQEWDQLQAYRAELDQAKADGAREISNVLSDINSATQKHERFDLRKQKFNEQYDRLVSAKAQDANARLKLEAYRQAQAGERKQLEEKYHSMIAGYTRAAEEYRDRTVLTIAQSQHLEALILQNARYGQAVNQQNQYSTPTTPEGPLPGTNSAENRNSFPSFQFPLPTYDAGLPQDLPPATTVPLANTLYASTHRGRSSSMLSGVSGFTDNLDDENQFQSQATVGPMGSGLAAPYAAANGYGLGNGNSHFPAYAYALNGRKGSGDVSSSSGSGSSSGSQRDPMSPPPNVLSPVGTKAASPGQHRGVQ